MSNLRSLPKVPANFLNDFWRFKVPYIPRYARREPLRTSVIEFGRGYEERGLRIWGRALPWNRRKRRAG